MTTPKPRVRRYSREDLSREDLIKICEAAFVLEDNWQNRDSASSQIQIGSCLALLKAGCKFIVLYTDENDGDVITDDKTIWLRIWFNGFRTFEGGPTENDLFYLPTLKRLEANQGGDWC